MTRSSFRHVAIKRKLASTISHLLMGITWRKAILTLVLIITILQVIHITLTSRLEAIRRERRKSRGLSVKTSDDSSFSSGLHSLSDYSRQEMDKDYHNMLQSVLESSVLDSSGEFSIINNWIRGKSFKNTGVPSLIIHDITLVSLTSLSGVHHINDIVERWKGPISIGIFCLAKEIVTAIKLIILFRNCYPSIRYNTTFHLVYPLHHFPIPNFGSNDNNLWHSMSLSPHSQSLSSCLEISQILSSIKTKTRRNYANHGVPFPNNLLRNVARRNSLTDYIFVVDIDLVPNQDLHGSFLTFAHENKLFEEQMLQEKRVYVVPSFEIDSSQSSSKIPQHKAELLKLIANGSVRPFYYELCWKCQKYTDYDAWEREPITSRLLVSFEVNWNDPWEPFYISHNSAPMYDERFRQYGFNRISQVCELYVAGYKFSVLNNAFLVHKGLKKSDSFHKNKDLELERNRMLFRHFKAELKDRYASSTRQC
ncbi:beta-1,4-glucuronyltransferase 1-like [Brevipalpus obovatus]|uniref:beta-1,4-glucuronyltransferase 1-like n=1 Tax=Brevipalpus obovatus TaxID=246614 RepID=UPI003D9E990B